MSGQDREVPDHFHQATELMQTIHGVKTLGYWKWYEEVSTWALQFEIDIGTSHHLSVPVITEWYVLITDRYPLGRVRVYPAFERGLNVTFHHQRFNQPRSDLPWTHGEICTDVPGYLLERLVPTKEPYSIRERLCWHIERAKEWIKAAAANDLIRTGERFELPDFRISTLGAKRFAYSEGEDSIRRWDAIGKKSGLVKLLQISQNKTIQIVPSTFLDLDRNILMEVQWSNYFRSGSDTLGGWVLLPEIPVIPPWQAPHTWGEVFSSALELGVDLEISLNNVFSRLRDGQAHILLIGFPIPKLVGRPFIQIHWVAISLPRLSTIRKLKGFRPTAENAMRFDRTSTLSNNQVVKWLESNNWNRQSLGSRGNMEVIRQLNVVIIGQGALGSSIAEMLVRLGLEKIVLIDGDNVEAGNLSRHALTLREEKMNKSIAMALRLSSISPQAQVRNIDFYINPQNSQCREAIEQADLVIDCTADDEVLAEMHEFSWKNTAIFTSIFVGLYGKRVYIYSSPGWSFSSRDFKRALDPLIKEDYAAHPDFVLPHENIGCWHPIFPARSDDIWLACTLAVKEIESVLQTGKDHSELILIKYEDEIRREVVPLNGYYKYSAPDTPVSIRVVSSVFESLKVICRTSKARETGGILVGKYNEDGNVIEVLEALPPPDDSHGTISTFFRGIFGLSDKLTTRWEKSGTYYIGEWHYHTAGIGQPSNQDIVQMLEFAKAEEMQLAFPVMVIAFPSADNQYAFRVFLFTQDEQYSELNDTSEVPREKL